MDVSFKDNRRIESSGPAVVFHSRVTFRNGSCGVRDCPRPVVLASRKEEPFERRISPIQFRQSNAMHHRVGGCVATFDGMEEHEEESNPRR